MGRSGCNIKERLRVRAIACEQQANAAGVVKVNSAILNKCRDIVLTWACAIKDSDSRDFCLSVMKTAEAISKTQPVVVF